MNLRLPSRKSLVLTFAGLIAIYLLFAWLALPPILQDQAEKFISGKTGHRLTMSRPEFNPFELRLRLTDLHLAQADGEPLLAFRELVVDLSAASIVRRAIVFDEIRLDGLQATAVLLPNGRLNWSALIDALKSKEETPDQPLPRFDIQRFVLAGARADFADRRMTPAFTARIEPMDVELTDLSSQRDDKGQYKLAARTTVGARVVWHGDVSLEPLAATGNISVEDLDLGRLAAYLRDVLPIAPPAGVVGVSADYRFGYAQGRPALNLEHIAARLTGLKVKGKEAAGPTIAVDTIEAKEGRFDLAKSSIALGVLSITNGRLELQQGRKKAPEALQVGSIALEDARVDLALHQATLGRIAVNGGRVSVTRDARGGIDLMQALQGAMPSAPGKRAANPTTASAPAEAGWHYRLDKLVLAGFTAAFRDETVSPAADLVLEDIALSLEGISDDPKAATMPLRASFKAQRGGSFEAEGKIARAGPTADIRLKLAGLSLTPAQPYLSAAAKLKLADGRLSSEGRARYDAKGIRYSGSFALVDLRLTESATDNLFLAWKSLGSRAFEVTAAKLDVGELVLDGIDTRLIIDKDKSTNLKRIMRQADAAATPVQSAPAAPAAARAAPSFQVNIDRLRLVRGEMDFADYSLALPFATRIHDLQGIVAGLSTRPGAPGQVELDGQVDEYGLARAVGQIDYFDPSNFMDLKVVFRNIEMTRLTPYSGTFAGRKIASGKLSLDLQYKIKQHQLQGENQVVMDQLTLGERVDSPEAKDLPLDLAIAILQDSNGRIELGLPVSGSLDDPQFSYGGIVWKAIVNVLTKIATAPFRALASLFGGGEKLENVAFEAGNAQLTPPEREKLVQLAAALAKRPGLSLAVGGVYAEADREALQDSQMRRSVAEKSGLRVKADSDPGPISTRQPKVQSALESLYAERFSGAELAAIKEGFRQANPGQLEQSTGLKVLSRLSGLMREKQALNQQEVAQMKGGDYYAILFDRLRNKVVVDDERLLLLAKARGEAIAMVLKTAGAPGERLAVLPAEKVASDGRNVPAKLLLGPAAKTGRAAGSGAN